MENISVESIENESNPNNLDNVLIQEFCSLYFEIIEQNSKIISDVIEEMRF